MTKANNKTQATDLDVDSFLAAVADDARREDCQAVLKLMRAATKAKPKMWGTSIVGFGDRHLKYASGRELDWFLVGFSPRKQDLTLYIMPGFARYDTLLKKLGKHKIGGSCLYIKKLADVDLATLKELIGDSVRHYANA
jgi:hypothetical protein